MTTKKQMQERRATLRPHPARDKIIDALRSYGKPISPARLSGITGETLGSTAYHVRTLVAAGMVELADEGRVRGAVEHFYALAAGVEAPQVSDPINKLLAVCDALTLPGEEGGYPRPSVIDQPAREQLRVLIDQLRPQVQSIAAAATRRSLGG
jgi:DNA-binding transcriptional ArsR family regulator